MVGLVAALAALALPVTGLACGGDGGDAPPTAPAATEDAGGDGGRYPEIVAVEATASGTGSYDFAVTISSPYDSPQRYADGWRVLGLDGTVLGEMELLHDHASEQPFTRLQTGVAVPEGTARVLIEGHDLENGYGGGTFEVELPLG